jgi:cyclic pyranopterin phosphate synthase
MRITRRCNAACAFCQAPYTDRAELTVPEIGLVSRRLADEAVVTLKLSGGEPTVRTDLPEILATVAAGGIKPVVITNGIRIREPTLSAAREVGAEFKLSIHRPSSANDRVLGVKSFSDILANMVELRRRGIRFSINSVVTPQTVHLLRPLAMFATDSGARKISFIPVVARGRALGNVAYAFSDAELADVRARISALVAEVSGLITIRCIDIRRKDYWIIENDGSLWIEKAWQEIDVRLCGKEELIQSQERSILGVRS